MSVGGNAGRPILGGGLNINAQVFVPRTAMMPPPQGPMAGHPQMNQVKYTWIKTSWEVFRTWHISFIINISNYLADISNLVPCLYEYFFESLRNSKSVSIL